MTSSNHQIFRHPDAFTLESGRVLQGYHLAYHTYGMLSPDRDNTVWVFHALTANSDPEAWWPGLVGPGCFIDPAQYFIVCVNMPGSCYGSIGPLEEMPGLGRLFYHDFPFFTIRDMVRAYRPLRDALGIRRIKIGIGGSMGGQQLLEWAIDEPDGFEYIFPIATNAWQSAWGKAFNESQRWCIEADPSWKEESPSAGVEGMKIARSVALLSYRSYHTYDLFQSDEDPGVISDHKASSYQHYQGEKLARRFNAFSYYQLSRSMDSHHVGRHAASAGASGIPAAPGAVPRTPDASRATGAPSAANASAAPANPRIPAIPDAYRSPATPGPPGSVEDHDAAAAGLRAAKALARIRAKTLVIGLKSDLLFPLTEQQFLARHIPWARFIAIDSVYGHDGFLLEAEAIGRAAKEFLNAATLLVRPAGG
jgi:homoserine O-acetyltransferase/O-succinyltransferase